MWYFISISSLLFLLCINYIGNVCDKFNFILFADDTTTLSTHKILNYYIHNFIENLA